MSDGGLRQLEMKHIAGAHFQSIETWSTGQGVPDVNVCIDGVESWIENKLSDTWRLEISSQQVAWVERRLRNGGRVFVAVRRHTTKGPRKGAACDELHLYSGHVIRKLSIDGMIDNDPPVALLRGAGGPARWPWAKFRSILINV